VVETAQTQPGGRYLWGPASAVGVTAAVFALVLDQASKFWLLYGFDLAARAPFRLMPLVDLVLTFNTGISYGLFSEQGPLGQAALFLFKVAAVLVLWVWLSRTQLRLTAASLGLIIGGAVGNAIDRLHWPGVMDFVLLHYETPGWAFRWYIFNVADIAIVAGVIGLLYESLVGKGAAKAP
jgi:signal peptidase II